MMLLLAWTIYDYFLTFGREVSYVWTRRLSAASIVYLINRYGVIAEAIELIFTSDLKAPVCY